MRKNKKIGIIAAIVAILVIIAGIITAVVLTNSNSEPDGNNPGGNTHSGQLKNFSFGKSYGLGGAVDYILVKQDGKALLKCNFFGAVSEKDRNIEKTIDAKYLDELEKILKDNNIAAWNGFDESEDGVLDGGGFSMRIEYEDGSSVNAHGYMRYPDNYEKARDELDAFFKRLIDEA